MKKVSKNSKWLFILVSLPILVFLQYFLFKFGVLSPIVRGIELKVVNGDYVTDIDEYTIKLNDKVKLSSGDYICIPSYAKKPNIWFNVLDSKNILEIKGNELIGKKEGISTIGVMKNQRVLRKVNVRVIDPKVEDITYDVDNNLKYVGDIATITSEVKVNYDKFKGKEKVFYESSNEDVIKIDDNKIEAVGVGSAKVYIKSKDIIETLKYNIQAKIAEISISSTIEVGLEKSKKLKPDIITMPVGLKHPKIRYELVENKLGVDRNISLDKNTGVITGIKEGKEKIRIICGEKEKIVTIKVSKESVTSNKVENIKALYEIVDGKLLVKLSWDYINDVNEYYIYLKNNSLNYPDFNLYDSIKVQKDKMDSNTVYKNIEIDLINGKIPDISIYVAGKTKYGMTNPSNTINIKPIDEDIQNAEVKNLKASIDSNNNLATLTWDKLDIKNVKYSIYVKNNLNQDEGFTLLESNIESNKYTIKLSDENVDLEVYVKANKDDKYSKHSNIEIIKRKVSDEDVDIEEPVINQ